MTIQNSIEYHYPFSFPFDYGLLLSDALKLSPHQIKQKRTGYGKNYGMWKEGDKITHYAAKLDLYKTESIINNPYTKSIITQCKKLFDAIGCVNNDIILLEYDDESYLDWHIDHGYGKEPENYGRINTVLTDNWQESPIIFKDGNREIPCPSKLAVVNAYNHEHRYDNRDRDKRILLIMTTKDMSYGDCVDAIKRMSI